MRKKRINRIALSMILSFAFVITALTIKPTKAGDGISYISRSWNSEIGTVEQEEKICDNYETIDNSTSELNIIRVIGSMRCIGPIYL